MQRITLALLSIGLLAGCLSNGGDSGGSGTVADVPQVLRITQVDPVRWSGEPSILALADGTLLITGAGGFTRYVEDPTDIPGNFGQSYVWRSTDGGANWTFVALDLPEPLGMLLPYRNAIVGVEGDLADDEAGHTYFVDLSLFPGVNGLSRSDDSGATWTAAQTPVVGLPASDRPWVAAYGDGQVFVKYLTQADGHHVSRSTDAGVTFPEDVAIPPCGQGPLASDRSDASILVPCVVGSNVFVLRHTGSGPMVWESIPVATADNSGDDFPAVAVAGPGQYVMVWRAASEEGDGTRILVSASLDRGATWSEPLQVSAPDRTSVFPWIDANADGTVAVVWYEADQAGDPNTMDAEWRVHLARLDLGATGLSAPAAITVTTDPIHVGSICTAGLNCVIEGRAEDRRLLDFFEVDVDAAGAAHIAWTSTETEVPSVWYGQVK